MTNRQDLLSKPYFNVGLDVLKRVSSVYIIPNRRKHDSGYNCMDMVATLEDGTQYRIAGSCDDIAFYGKHFRVDCEYPSRIIHVWNSYGSFKVYGNSSINFEEE